MSSKNNILIITAPIKSHIMPSFFLANMLSRQYSVYYLAADQDTEDLITNQGYGAVKSNTERFAIGAEDMVLYTEGSYKDNRIPLRDAIKMYVTNKLYRRRKNELSQFIKVLRPQAIYIDIFSSTDFLVLYPYSPSIKLFFFNPMLSTYTVEGVPSLKEGNFNAPEIEEDPSDLPKIPLISKFLDWFFTRCTRLQFKKAYYQNGVYKKHKLAKSNPLVRTFEQVPEIILAPLEFELSPKVKKEYQFYLGLCIDTNRKEIGIDETFDQAYSQILNKLSNQRKKLLYCSFGTYFSSVDEHKTVASFLLALIEAFRNEPDIYVIISANEFIQNAIYKLLEIPPHFSIFKKVRQLEVLKNADVFITHGGLGSIKEAIFYEVPMLVYPLDMRWDQNGNGLKVEYHEIGLRGDILNDEPEEIQSKVQQLISNKRYKDKIHTFSQRIKEKYVPQYSNHLLEELLK